VKLPTSVRSTHRANFDRWCWRQHSWMNWISQHCPMSASEHPWAYPKLGRAAGSR